MTWTELGPRDLVDTVQHASRAIRHTVGFQTHFPNTWRQSKMDNRFKLLFFKLLWSWKLASFRCLS